MKYIITRRTNVWESEYPFPRRFKGVEIGSISERVELELDYDLRVGDLVFNTPIKSINLTSEGHMFVVIENDRTDIIGKTKSEYLDDMVSELKDWGDCPLQYYVSDAISRTGVSGDYILLNGYSAIDRDLLLHMRARNIDTNKLLIPKSMDLIFDYRDYLMHMELSASFVRSPINNRKIYSPLFKIINAKLNIWRWDRIKWRKSYE